MSEGSEKLFKRGEIVAVRSEDDDFYLCRVLQHVFKGLQKVKVWWLEQEQGGYRFGHQQFILVQSFMMPVKMHKAKKNLYELPEKEKEKIEDVLAHAIIGKDFTEDEEEEEKEVVGAKGLKRKAKIQKGPNKTKKTTTKRKPTKNSSTKATEAKTKVQKKEAKPRKGKEKKSTRKQPKVKKPSKSQLQKRPDVKVMEKDPFFHSNAKHPFISPNVEAKLLFRALNLNDNIMFKKVMTNYKQVPSSYEDISPSVDASLTVQVKALLMKNVEVVEMMHKQKKSDDETAKDRVNSNTCLLEGQGTGNYNFKSLGHAVRDIQMSRGSREGNNALRRDVDNGSQGDCDLSEALAAADVSWVHVKSLKGLDGAGRWDLDMNIASFIDWGNVEVAYHLLDDKIQAGGWGFNNLFRDVLVFPGCKEVDGKKKAAKKTEKKTPEVSKDDAVLSPSAVIRPVSVVKKSHTSKNMTPLHCASINTNPAYLEKLLSICPETNIQDNRRKRPVHFAAASRSPACLKVLLGRGASPDEVCAAGNTALFYAAKTGRRENVELLIKRGLDQIATGIAVDKFGVAGLNRGNRSSYCPLHVAVQNGHIKVVELLLKHGAAIEKPLSATKNKVTPLMLACQKGDMNMVRVLASHGAKLDGRDKLKRSPLMHAVINGQTAVASLLIHSGVALDHVDTSGNSALLYAVAYGWYFSVKLLIDCGADLDLANMWKVPPLGIAFLKGHLGLFEYILDASDSVDINYKDLQGFTLVMSILKGTEADLVLSQLEYLVTEKKAKCDLVDLKGNSCLHVLCTNKTLICQDKKLMIEAPKEKKERKSVLLSAAKLLIKAGCSTNAVNESGDTAVSIAAGNGCVQLMTLLLDSGASLVPPLPSTVLDEDGGKKNNILHYLSSFADQKEVLEFFVKIGDDINNGGGDELIKLKKMANETNQGHLAPLHILMKKVLSVANLTVSAHGSHCNLQQEELEEKQQTCLGFLKLLLSDFEADVNKPQKLEAEDEAKRKGDAVLHMISKTSGTAVAFVIKVLQLLLTFKPDVEQLSFQGSEAGKTPLNSAISSGLDETVEMLLQHGCNSNFRMTSPKAESIPLILATQSGNLAKMNSLLTHNADPNLKDFGTGNTALHVAVLNLKGSAVKVIKFLLENGASPNATNTDLRTPFHLAVNNTTGHTDESTEVIETLIAQKADLFAIDNRGRLPLHYAFVKVGNPLQSSEMDPIEICTILTSAMKFQAVDTPDKFGSTPLHYASVRGAVVCCMHLLKRGSSVNRKNRDGNTALGLAVRSGHRSCALNLIQQDSDLTVDIHPSKVESGQDEQEVPFKVMRWLPVHANKTDSLIDDVVSSSEPLFEKVMKQNWQGELYVMLDLLEKWGLTFATVIVHAMECRQLQVASRLIRKCHDVDILKQVDQKGRNLLHILAFFSAASGQQDVITKVAEMLIDQAGLPLTLADQYGCTPLHYCIFRHDFKLAEVFLDKIPEQQRLSAFRAVSNLGHTLLTSLVWKLGNCANAEKESRSVGVVSWVDACIKHGADFDAVASFLDIQPHFFGVNPKCNNLEVFVSGKDLDLVKKSTIIVGVELKLFSLVKTLLKSGAAVNCADPNYGHTPLMVAAKFNHDDIIKVILDHSYEPKSYKQAGVKRSMSGKKRAMPKGGIFGGGGLFGNNQLEENQDGSSSEESSEREESDSIVEDSVEENEAEEKEDDEEEDEEEEDEEEEDEEEEDEEEEDESENDDQSGRKRKRKLTSRNLFTTREKKVRKESAKKKKKPFVKTSQVDLTAKDKRSWTVMHHLVSPMDGATFSNVKMFQLLHKNGAVLDVSVLELALSPMVANVQLSRMIQILMQKDEKEWINPTPTFPIVPDPIVTLSRKMDFQADARAFLTSLHEPCLDQRKATQVDSVVIPSENIPVTTVVIDEETDTPYDFLGSKVDVGWGPYGMFNYYKMQVVHQEGKDLYILLTRWGRFGDSGKYQQTPFESEAAAVKEFKSIFKAKTKNDWDIVKKDKFSSFVHFSKKYRILQREDGKKTKLKEGNSSLLTLKSSISSEIGDSSLRGMLFDLTRSDMLDTAVEQLSLGRRGNRQCFGPSILAFSDTSRESLVKALQVLYQIGVLVKAREGNFQDKKCPANEANEANAEQLMQLSNEFFHLVPLRETSEESLSPIASSQDLNDKVSLLSKILDIHTTAMILAAAQHNIAMVNPFDYIYQSINCKIKSLAEDEREAQCILRYIHASASSVKVHGIYALERPGELERVVSKGVDNHKVLFHGTGKENVLSILTRGLLIAPPEVPVTGHAYGMGVYFADQFVKSQSYASGNRNRRRTSSINKEEPNSSYMLLCQVALGKQQSHVHWNHNTGMNGRPTVPFNSVLVRGQREPDPSTDVTLSLGGVTMPLGAIVDTKEETGWNQHSEYVIFDEDQIALRYLIRFSE